MKRLLLLSLCIFMAVALMAGCTPTPSESSSPDASASSAAPSESSEASQSASAGQEIPHYKIGMAYSSWAIPEAIAIKTQLDGIAADFNCEMLYEELPSRDLEGLLAANEALIQGGCDGIISVSLTPAIAQACIDAEVPFILSASAVSNPDILAITEGSPYFVGSLVMDAVQVGYAAAQSVYDAGCRNICYIAPGEGVVQTHDDWVKGIENFAADHADFKILSSSRQLGVSPAIDLFRTMYSAFPDIECVIETGCDLTLVPGLYTDNLQSKVKYATLAGPGDVAQAYQDGCMILSGVPASFAEVSFAALYNAMSGHNLISDNTKSVSVGYIMIANNEEYQTFINTVQNAPFYTADELKQFCPVFNPDATYDDFANACAALSLQDIITRHGPE